MKGEKGSHDTTTYDAVFLLPTNPVFFLLGFPFVTRLFSGKKDVLKLLDLGRHNNREQKTCHLLSLHQLFLLFLKASAEVFRFKTFFGIIVSCSPGNNASAIAMMAL